MPSIRSTSTANNGLAAYQCTKPAGTVAGDLLFAFQVADRGPITNLTAPTGGATWQLLDTLDNGSNQFIRLWWKVAGASEPASYTINQRSGSDGAVIMVAVMGAVVTTPVVAHGTAGSGSLITTPSITPPAAGSLEIRFVGAYPEGVVLTFTAPSGFTKVLDAQSRNYTAASSASRLLSGTGSTGTADFTVSAADLQWRAGFTMAIAPDAPPEVPKASSDKASLTETASVAADVARSDSAALVESARIGLAIGDAATLVESSTVAAGAATADSAALTEAATIEAGHDRTDVATLAESATVTADHASGDDAVLIEFAEIGLLVTDSATLVESAHVERTTGPTTSDIGTLVESVSVGAELTVTDTATLVESASVAHLKETTDTASLVESATIGVPVTDQATLVESAHVEVFIETGDAAALADQVAVELHWFSMDSATLVESATVSDIGRDIAGLGPMYRRWSAGSPYSRYSAGEPRRAWGAGSPRT
ncbi:hypothetical protein ACQP25_17195 [Microtetraspora malaysiensis]|uniref:hypothetical protein n=1 Tax=Microtetraspora malaysiensis TaxID=161358 RepID=UPI003D8FD54F